MDPLDEGIPITISAVPPELFLIVCHHLDIISLPTLLHVCHDWRDAILSLLSISPSNSLIRTHVRSAEAEFESIAPDWDRAEITPQSVVPSNVAPDGTVSATSTIYTRCSEHLDRNACQRFQDAVKGIATQVFGFKTIHALVWSAPRDRHIYDPVELINFIKFNMQQFNDHIVVFCLDWLNQSVNTIAFHASALVIHKEITLLYHWACQQGLVNVLRWIDQNMIIKLAQVILPNVYDTRMARARSINYEIRSEPIHCDIFGASSTTDNLAQSCFTRAVRHNRAHAIRYLLSGLSATEKQLMFSERGDCSGSSLMHACNSNSTRSVMALLYFGASVPINAPTTSIDTPTEEESGSRENNIGVLDLLRIAMWRRSLIMTKQLMDALVRQVGIKKCLEMLNNRQEVSLTESAILIDDVRHLEFYHRMGVEISSCTGESLLMRATSGGYYDVVNFMLSILKWSPNDPRHMHANNASPLFVAIRTYGRLYKMVAKAIPIHTNNDIRRNVQSNLVTLLLQYGANPNHHTSYALDRHTAPIHMAAKYGIAYSAQALLNHPQTDILARDDRGWTALHYAAKRGHFIVCQQLMTTDVDRQKQSSLRLSTATKPEPTTTALVPQNAMTNSTLMESPTTLINAVTLQGETALFLACQKGHGEIVSLLLRHGASPNLRQETTGFSPLQVAVICGHILIVKQLLTDPEVNLDFSTAFPQKVVQRKQEYYCLHKHNMCLRMVEAERVKRTSMPNISVPQ